MRKLTPGWTINGKLICVECVDHRPKGEWTLIQAAECSNAANHHKKEHTIKLAEVKRRKKSGNHRRAG